MPGHTFTRRASELIAPPRMALGCFVCSKPIMAWWHTGTPILHFGPILLLSMLFSNETTHFRGSYCTFGYVFWGLLLEKHGSFWIILVKFNSLRFLWTFASRRFDFLVELWDVAIPPIRRWLLASWVEASCQIADEQWLDPEIDIGKWGKIVATSRWKWNFHMVLMNFQLVSIKIPLTSFLLHPVEMIRNGYNGLNSIKTLHLTRGLGFSTFVTFVRTSAISSRVTHPKVPLEAETSWRWRWWWRWRWGRGAQRNIPHVANGKRKVSWHLENST